MTDQPQDFGEPWLNGLAAITDRDGSLILGTGERRDRITACVNAMSGIADPADFVRRARKMEKHIRAVLDDPAFEELMRDD